MITDLLLYTFFTQRPFGSRAHTFVADTGKSRLCSRREQRAGVLMLEPPKNYVPSRKKMFGALGSTSGHNFYMGMQNGSKLGKGSAGLLIFAFNVEMYMQCVCSPYVCIGSHSFAMFTTHTLCECAWLSVHI